mgnify:CR=1 FL=1
MQNIRDFLDFDIQIHMKIKEKIMEKEKKSKEIKIIFLNSTLGVEYVCYNRIIKQERRGR